MIVRINKKKKLTLIAAFMPNGKLYIPRRESLRSVISTLASTPYSSLASMACEILL